MIMGNDYGRRISSLAVHARLLRPTQWLKNLMLLFPPFLGGVIFQEGMLRRGIVPIVSFCLASSATYVLNDVLDANDDANHHIKKNRPIPSGEVRKATAAVMAAISLAAALYLGARQTTGFLMLLLAYLAVATAYSLKLKEFPIVDIFCISAGFLFRLQAGGAAFGVPVSEWLFLSVFLLSLFLSTGKRLGEKKLLGEGAGNHRRVLLTYPGGFLEGTMYLTGGAVLVVYTMYVISRHIQIYTVPLCAFGLLHYILRVKTGEEGDPTESLLKDRVLFAVGFLWAVMIGWGVYGR